MRIALTGATGRLGGMVLERLLNSGHVVRTIGRRALGPDFVEVDLTNAKAIESALDDCDWLVHVAGKIHEGGDLSSNVQMAMAVGLAAGRSETAVINFSSLSVYGKTAGTTVSERSACSPVTEYGQSKLEAESALDGSDCSVCHLRIGNVYTKEAFDDLAGRTVKRILKSSELTNLIFAEDVADIVGFLVESPILPLPDHLNVVRSGLGNLTIAEAFLRTNRRSSRGIIVPAMLPHLLRRATGVSSLKADRRFDGAALAKLGYEYKALETVAPSEWGLTSTNSFADLSILHATDSVDRSVGGGTATRTLDVAGQLASRGARCSIVSMDPAQKRVSRSLIDGVEHVVLPSRLKRFYLPVGNMREIQALVREHDVLHLMGHWSLLNILLARMAERSGVPYVICPAGSLRPWGRSGRLKRVFDKAVGNHFVRHASGWIAVVEEEVSDFATHRIESSHVTVIPNGANLETDLPSPTQIEATKEHLVLPREYVLFLGRLNLIKGPDLLLKAFLAVADQVSFDLVLAGPDNGLLEELQEMAAQSNTRSRVHFPGFVDGSDKKNMIAGCRVLAIPSRKEAMSVVVLEAAALGRPVMATTECGLSELLGSGGGWLVSASEEGLAGGLLSILGGECDSLGQRLQVETHKRFGWDVIAQQYMHLYSEFGSHQAESESANHSEY